MGFEIQQPQFEHGEEADRPCAQDRDICFERGHGLFHILDLYDFTKRHGYM